MWKALDFEKMIKILGRDDSDNTFKLIRYINGIVDEDEIE